MKSRLLLLPLSVASLLGLGALWVRQELVTPYYGPEDAEVFVDIPQGLRSKKIAELLQEAGIIRHQLPLLLYLRWSGTGSKLKAGEYRFAKPDTPPTIAQRLLRGEVYYRSVTIPEGMTARDTIMLIARTGLSSAEELQGALRRTEWIRDLDSQARDLEGYLFPETYRFPRRASAEVIVKAMVDRFREVLARLRSDYPVPSGRALRDIVILASMVEKEVKDDMERGLVASVLVNRLERGIPLACDPTVIYALRLAGRFDGNIRKPDLRIDSPYNTYIRAGLPPGPIANPGAASLKAALSPSKTDFLYFVSRNDGTHQFSKDLRDHERAVTRFQRGGRN